MGKTLFALDIGSNAISLILVVLVAGGLLYGWMFKGLSCSLSISAPITLMLGGVALNNTKSLVHSILRVFKS